MNIIGIALFTLILIILILTYIIYNLSKKEKKYIQIIEQNNLVIDKINNYMNNALNNLKAMDSSHAYETTDELGWFFTALKKVIIDLNNSIANTVNIPGNDNEEK